MTQRVVNVGLFGLGCVAQGLVRVLRTCDAHEFKFFVLCRDSKKERGLDLGYSSNDIIFASNADEIFDKPNLDVVVELMGGEDGLALEVVRRALTNKIPVVTANKALIAKHLDEIESLLDTHRGKLYFEASVCGGMPIIHVLQSFHIRNNDRVIKVEGIVNGSTNYLLWRLEQDASLDFVSMIVDMTSKGYLEADPSQDLDGLDAQSKIVILSRLAFGVRLEEKDIACFGLPDLHNADWQFVASNYQSTIRLIATAKEVKPNEICVVVMPTIVRKTSQYGMINKNYNCAKVVSAYMGELTMIGEGAGSVPTGQAVAKDVLEAVDSTNANLPIFPSRNENKVVKTWCVQDKFLLRVDKQQAEEATNQLRNAIVQKVSDAMQYCYIEFSATYADMRNVVTDLKKAGLTSVLLRILDSD